MLVFQTLLFAGYAYSDGLVRWLSPRGQLVVHSLVLLLAATQLPILPSTDWKPTGEEDPSLRVAFLLLSAVGLPYFVLSSTGPLLQAWFRRASPDSSPYRLYSLSNAGSLLALLSFPVLAEPYCTMHQLSWGWSAGFVVFGMICAYCAWQASVSDGRLQSSVEVVAANLDASARAAFSWFVLSLVPSVLMIAVTNQLCLDVAAIPFLWVLPLSLYLLSFVIAFDSPMWYRPIWLATATGIGGILMAYMLIVGHTASIQAQIAIYCSGFAAAALLCHGELAIQKPDPGRLTFYYLVVSLGGAVGGFITAIVAPRIFPGFFEFPLGIIAAGILAIIAGRRQLGIQKKDSRIWTAASLTGLAAMVALLGYGVSSQRAGLVEQSRSFFGVLRVIEEASGPNSSRERRLLHGNICHGLQLLDPELRRKPTMYYGYGSGVGLVMRSHHTERPRHFGVIGLGVGTLATYGKAGDRMTFYEIDPEVTRIAKNRFTFLEDSLSDVEVVPGDARLSLERQGQHGVKNEFDVLVLDAFSGDSIPTHLLTVEALDIYLNHLRDDGVIAVHITNRHFDLRPVIQAFVQRANLNAVFVESESSLPTKVVGAQWVLLTRDERVFAQPIFEGIERLKGRSVSWSDNFCSLWSVLRPFEGFDELMPGLEPGVDARIVKAMQLRREGKLVEAETEMRKLVRDRPDSLAWQELGNILRASGRREEAANCFRNALRLNPNSADAHNNLGALLISTNPQLAHDHLTTAIKLNPRQSTAYVNIGNLLVYQNRLDEALKSYSRAMELDPENQEAKMNHRAVREMHRDPSKK